MNMGWPATICSVHRHIGLQYSLSVAFCVFLVLATTSTRLQRSFHQSTIAFGNFRGSCQLPTSETCFFD
jgi:hypothetical protein